MTNEYAQTLVNQTIEYRIVSVYGRDNYYVVSEDHAFAIRLLTKKKTIDSDDMRALELLGFNFTRVV